MGGEGSGGANRLSLEELARRGTLRPGRMADRITKQAAEAAEAAASVPPCSQAARRRLLASLKDKPVAQRVARDILDHWKISTEPWLSLLTQLACSYQRVHDLEARADATPAQIHAEVSVALRLLNALDLD